MLIDFDELWIKSKAKAGHHLRMMEEAEKIHWRDIHNIARVQELETHAMWLALKEITKAHNEQDAVVQRMIGAYNRLVEENNANRNP